MDAGTLGTVGVVPNGGADKNGTAVIETADGRVLTEIPITTGVKFGFVVMRLTDNNVYVIGHDVVSDSYGFEYIPAVSGKINVRWDSPSSGEFDVTLLYATFTK